MGVEYPSFVKRIAGGIDLWSPTVTNDWSKDMKQGYSYGRELISHLRDTGQPTLLQHVVKAMIGHAAWGGVEVGFFQLISAEIISSGCADMLSQGVLCHRSRDVTRAEGAEHTLTPTAARDGE